MHIPVKQIDRTWTLFLDRDGVLNRKIDHDYVRNREQFEWLPGVQEALVKAAGIFGRIIIVTNQRGVGRGLMTVDALNDIHAYVKSVISSVGGRIDEIYFCSDVRDEGSTHRKPQPGMALDAQRDFPEIDFAKSIIVGDSGSDMEFGRNAGMFTVLVGSAEKPHTDLLVPSLKAFLDKLPESK